MNPSERIIEKANAIANGCIDDWDGEPPGENWYTPGLTPFDNACRALAMLTSPVWAEREAAKLMVRRWRMIGSG